MGLLQWNAGASTGQWYSARRIRRDYPSQGGKTLKKKAIDDTGKAAGGSCHSIGTAGNNRRNDECGGAAIPAGVRTEHVLASTGAEHWKENDGHH
jgi:hypothetical protein